WHTYPIFLETIQGLGFLETSLRRSDTAASWSGLPSYGLGVLTDITLFYSLPVTASIQFHQGMNKASGGRPEVFVDLRLGQLFF
ncbi:hypothetical protein EBZ37_06360, partial [bacterium]|nr:hypothetical protein [bacterium]